MARNVKKNTAYLWVLLGLIAGSFIPDQYSPLVLFKKKSQ